MRRRKPANLEEKDMSKRMAWIVLMAVCAPLAAAHDDHAPDPGAAPEKLGKVSFPTTCSPAVQAQFDRGVALLHSFWFPAGLKAFQAVAQQDPDCAMAYWGIALNRLLNPFNGVAAPPILKEGQTAIEQARAIGAKSERERDYIEAAAVLYTDVATTTWRSRTLAYEQAMANLARKYPEDLEAKVFYALALNVAADLNDQTYAKPLAAARLLEPLLDAHPEHPGIAHFLIHSYDFPPLAEKGLKAARRYAAIAPSAGHALHMPSHIFTRVGAWEDSAATNRRSEDVARAGSNADEALHAIDYQVYAYLQLARDGEASAALERARDYAARFKSQRAAGPYAVAAAPARYALERGDWKAAAILPVVASNVAYANAVTHFARAIGAARSGDAQTAGRDVDALAALHERLEKTKNAYWAGQVEIQRLAAAGWTAFAAGRRDEALALMIEAAEKESASEKAPISPGPILPARELYGDMLLELGQARAALEQYEASHQREPNRFRGWYGAASAAVELGDMGKARAYSEKLAALATAGSSRPELVRIRQWIAGETAR
jgi:hypothetical protein